MLNLIGGIDFPSNGQMYFLEKSLTDGGDKVLTNYRREEVGFVFQFYNLIPDLTAAENVALAAELVAEPYRLMKYCRMLACGKDGIIFPPS